MKNFWFNLLNFVNRISSSTVCLSYGNKYTAINSKLTKQRKKPGTTDVQLFTVAHSSRMKRQHFEHGPITSNFIAFICFRIQSHKPVTLEKTVAKIYLCCFVPLLLFLSKASSHSDFFTRHKLHIGISFPRMTSNLKLQSIRANIVFTYNYNLIARRAANSP